MYLKSRPFRCLTVRLLGLNVVLVNRAYNQSTGQKTPLPAGQKEQRAGLGLMSAETGGMHSGLYDDTQEAKLSAA